MRVGEKNHLGVRKHEEERKEETKKGIGDVHLITPFLRLALRTLGIVVVDEMDVPNVLVELRNRLIERRGVGWSWHLYLLCV